MHINLSNSYIKELPSDPSRVNESRYVEQSAFSYVRPRIPSAPSILHTSKELAHSLGWSEEWMHSKEFLDLFSGSSVYPHSSPYAMNYGGHQFGQWAGQLGDGRAINLFEIAENGLRYSVQLKGAGRTPTESADTR